MTTSPSLTPTSLKLFLDLAKDACNWSDQPLLNGNVQTDSALRGNLTQLKREGLLITTREEGCTWVLFTQKGSEFAASHGIKVQGLAD
ncbi:MAG: hypothetical protein BWY56_01844 [Acidobacteria bacterium ADurb.Bin340]|nr:MAG: hypothetical protein BWY56_01844 [Acidobacteria bacterium ADurb.Bin340]